MCIKSEVNLTRILREMSLYIQTGLSCWYRISVWGFLNFIFKHPISKLEVWKHLM